MGNAQKRGQLTIFVIVAVVIVAVLLIILLYPKIKGAVSGNLDPQSFLKGCIQQDLQKDMDLLNRQGGYANPEGFLAYNGEKIKYLCYTSQFYKTCVVQQPMIKSHYELELTNLLEPKAKECLNELETQYRDQGYGVSASTSSLSVSLVPHQLKIDFVAPMTISKQSTQTFSDFKISQPSEMYDLLMISESIVGYEADLGDSETTTYLQYYPDLKMQKLKLSDGSKVYTLNNVITNETFVFASRSLSWPPGYGIVQNG